MPLIDLKAVTKQFDTRKVLHEADFAIDAGERVAIVGQNGSGKSTLMKIAAGLMEQDSGERMVQNGITIEMLDQNPDIDEKLTVRQAIEASLTTLKAARERYGELSHQISADHDNAGLMNELTQLTNLLDFHNAWNLDDRVERILQEFDLKRLEDALLMTLSGGERRRVALSSLILKKPDLLLLDEPTNHLDVYMVKFLEETLLEGGFTLLLISHDRYFIDQLATRTVEVEEGRVRSFKGGYADYLVQKDQMLQSMIKTHETLVKLLKGEQEWLSRGVKARVKRNMGRVERIKQMKEEAKKNPGIIRRVKVQLEREHKAFNQEDGVNRKKMIFEVERLKVKLGDNELIGDFSTRILQQDKIAVVGRNGTGKSTLLRALLGTLKPTGGSIKRGEFTVGYFDQHREMLDDSKNIMETFCPMGGDHIMVRGRNMHVFGYLKNWLFPKEFLDKKLSVLSGGEKNRVALALLFSKNYDCLILDEPTNDLDIPTINILEEYLQSFQGALLFVSHDRYFVDKIAKKLFIFKGHGHIEETMESYTEYLEYEAEIAEIEAFEKSLGSAPAIVEAPEPKKEIKKLTYKEQRLLDALPGEIEALETEIKTLENCLMNPECYGQKGGLAELHAHVEKLKADLEGKVEHYLELEEKAAALRD
ncbi:MAG: ABC-F family ATP-binding cassette domain-containing protein [Campylobacterales bacterium]